MKKSLPILTTVLSLIIATHVQAQTGWKTYANDAVGYSVEIPANMRHVSYKEWAPEGDSNSAQQWRYQLFQAEGGKVGLEI